MQKKLVNEEIIDLLIINNNKDIEYNIKYLNIKLKHLISLRDIEIKNEPNHLFINKHKKWENNLKEINKNINTTYKEIENCIDDLIQK